MIISIIDLARKNYSKSIEIVGGGFILGIDNLKFFGTSVVFVKVIEAASELTTKVPVVNALLMFDELTPEIE